MNLEQLKAKLATLEAGTDEYNKVAAQIAKLEAQKLADTKKGSDPKQDIISDVVYNEFLRRAPKSVTKHDLTKEEAAKYLIQNDNDIKKACVAYLRACWKAQIEATPAYKDYEGNDKLQALIAEMVGSALNNLPDARILVQEIMTQHGTDVYDNVVSKLMPKLEFIYAGKGKDITTEYLPKVKVFDGAIVPSAQDLVDFRPENFSKNWSVELGSTIYQSAIIITEGDYITYFLSGKVDEYIEKAITGIAASIKVKQYIDCLLLVREIYRTLKAVPQSAEGAETNHIVGTATTFLDALKEFKELRVGMLQHNTRFFYDPSCGAKYTFAASKDIMHLVPIKTWSTRETYDATLLTNKGVDAIVENFLWMPETIYDPVTEQIISCDVFTYENEKVEVKSEGAILAIDSSKFQRLINLKISNKADYPWGLTQAYSSFARYGQAFDPRACVMLYENEDALTQNFVIPTQEQQENIQARKARKARK